MCATLSPALASAEEPAAARVAWAVLPVRTETPPPGDPTLLRLTRQIGEAIHDVVGEEVRVISRELRDDACPSIDGICPREVALLVGAERAISLVLKPGYSGLTVKVYAKNGLEREAELACKWASGLAECETGPFEQLFARKPAAPPLDPAVVWKAYQKLDRKLRGCVKLGWGEAAPARRPDQLDVQFRIGVDGHAYEVRLAPDGFHDVPAFACMARVVESLRISGGSEPPATPFKFKLPKL